MADDVGRLAASLGLDVTEFKTGITTANREMRVLKSEFQATEASMGPLASSMDGLKAKSENLGKQIDIQRQKVAKLADLHKQATEAKDMDKKAVDGLTIKLNNARTELGKMENELNGTNKAMVELGNTTKLTEAKMEQLSAKLKGIGDSAVAVGNKLTMEATLPIIATGGAAIKFASDIEESLSKVDVVFEGSSKKIKDWSENTIDSLGLAQSTTLEMASSYGDLATSMEITTSKAAEMSMALTGRAADLSSFKNIRIDVAETALTAIFTGETESLKKLGVVMTQANLQAYALSQGITKNIQDMSESEKVNLRYAYVMEKTSNAAGDYARTSESAANQSRSLKESLKEAAADIGNMLLPTYTLFVGKIKDVVQNFIKLDSETKQVIITTALVIAAIGPSLIAFGKMATGISAIVAVVPKLILGLQAMNAGFLTLLANPVVLMFGAIAVAIAAVGVAAYQSAEQTKRLKQELLATIQMESDARIGAINDSYQLKLDSLDNELNLEKQATNERISLLDEEYEAKKEAASKGSSATNKSLQEQSKALEESHQKEIARIQEEYGVFEEKAKSKTALVIEERDKQIKALEEELSAAEEVYNQSIALLDKEYGSFEEKSLSKVEIAKQEADDLIKEATRAHDEKIKLFDEELKRENQRIDRSTDMTIGNLEDKIALIEGATEEEVAIEKKKRLEARIIELEDLIASETDAQERVRLVQEREALIVEAIAISVDQQLETQKYAIREEILNEKIKGEELKIENQAVKDAKVLAADNALLEETRIINEKTAAEIAKLEEELEAKKTVELEKLEQTRTRITDELLEINTKADEEIQKLQEERIAKETAENAKYLATKTSLDAQLESLSTYQTTYYEKLAEELKEKQRIENEKLIATENRIASEKKALEDAMADEIRIETAQTNAQSEAVTGEKNIVLVKDIDLSLVPAAYLQQTKDLMSIAAKVDPTMTVDMNSIITGKQFAYDLQGNQVNATTIPTVPAKAIGDNSWVGGLVQVHEKGGEIINLPSRSQIIPHDISMQMAESYGRAMAKQKPSVKQTNNFYSPKALTPAEVLSKLKTQERLLTMQFESL